MVKVVQDLGGYHTINGAARATGATFWEVYNFIKRHDVPTIKVGRTVMVKLADLNGLQK